MREFAYARPQTVGEAVALLDEYGPDARLLAGGTDLVIGFRDGSIRPKLVIDLKHIDELRPAIEETNGSISISASTVMADIAGHPAVQKHFPALVEAAQVVGSVQIRNRATLAGNICNGSPAADCTPPLLVYDAVAVIVGPGGERRMAIDEFIVGPGKTALERGELVSSFELPVPDPPFGCAYTRLTRRWGTDLASITLCCGVDSRGITRLAYGSVGPRALLVIDESGVLADPDTSDEVKAPVLDELFADASPSVRSMRASPDYRLAMLRVLGARALQTAIDRLAKESIA